jgi:hypothetical protein
MKDVKHNYCITCSKLCEEAKDKIKKLEKKVYALTIVCTSAITLLGEHGGKVLLDSLSTYNKAIGIANNEKENKNDQKDKDHTKEGNNNKVSFGVGGKFNQKHNFKDKESTKPYSITDELAKAKKEEKQDTEVAAEITDNKTPKQIAKIATSTQVPSLEIPVTNLFNQTDPYSVFFTPSYMPFDVYSTTLALGNNYGFGEYYGIQTSNITPAPAPGAIALILTSFLVPLKKKIRST